MKRTTFIIFLVSLICCAKSARILGVFPIPERSHYNLGSALMRALAEKGHDVTMISPFVEANAPKTSGSYRDITSSGILEESEEKLKHEINMFNIHNMCPFINAFSIATSAHDVVEKTLKHENVQNLIHSGETFDVVIVEQFLNDAHKALATHFKAPLIVLSTVGANFWVNSIVGNPSPLSYVPDIMLEYSSHMNFIQRLKNSALYVFNHLLYHFYVFPKQNDLIKKYIPNGPDLDDVLYNASLVLLNSHPSTNQPVPHVPNMVEVGGFHVRSPKPLPNDLQEFLDNSKHGVIYFSMGSNLRSSQLPKEKLEALLETFSKLKENVLFKWEEGELPRKLDNVKTGKWLPQQDILAHPNVKLFITHGGILSLTEAVYHGVPVLIIPVFGDQFLNARFFIDNGYGVSISYDEISEDNLMERISTILNNSRYKDAIKSASYIFHDRLVSPMETAIYWVEYVIRQKGAPHLKVAALDLSWYKYYLLDIIIFIILIVFFLLLLVRYAVKKLLNKFSTKKTDKKVKKR